MTNLPNVVAKKDPSNVQRSLRERSQKLELKEAVCLAADNLFGFTRRASDAKALWSKAWTVWLGRSTFFNWSLEDADIDIPWVVAGATNAPQHSDELIEAVQNELAAYWTNRLSALPRRSTGNWLPLP